MVPLDRCIQHSIVKSWSCQIGGNAHINGRSEATQKSLAHFAGSVADGAGDRAVVSARSGPSVVASGRKTEFSGRGRHEATASTALELAIMEPTELVAVTA